MAGKPITKDQYVNGRAVTSEITKVDGSGVFSARVTIYPTLGTDETLVTFLTPPDAPHTWATIQLWLEGALDAIKYTTTPANPRRVTLPDISAFKHLSSLPAGHPEINPSPS